MCCITYCTSKSINPHLPFLYMAAKIKQNKQNNLRHEPMACCANSVLCAISTLNTLLAKNCFYQNFVCVTLAVNPVVKKQ